MCLFQRLFNRFKTNSHEELVLNENVEMQNGNKVTVEQNEETVVNDTIEAKIPLDQQILKAREKSTSDDNSTSEDSGREIGPRFPNGTTKTDKER